MRCPQGTHLNSREKSRPASPKHFAGRGHKQIPAGDCDHDPKRIAEWLRHAARAQAVVGVRQTTWESSYDELEAFAPELRPFRHGG